MFDIVPKILNISLCRLITMTQFLYDDCAHIGIAVQKTDIIYITDLFKTVVIVK